MNELPGTFLTPGSGDIPGQFSVRDHKGECCHDPAMSVEGEDLKHLRENLV